MATIRCQIPATAKALFQGPEDYGEVENGVVRYRDDGVEVFGMKRPDGSIDIYRFNSPYVDDFSVSPEVREEIYSQLEEYEGPAPKRYRGPKLSEPIEYEHVETGGTEANDGEAVIDERRTFTRIKDFLAGKVADIL